MTKDEMIAYVLMHASRDPDKAEDVLAFFCDAVESNEFSDGGILTYLAKRFRQVLEGVPAAEALGLSREKGQRRARTYQRIDERDTSLARSVLRLMDEGVPLTMGGPIPPPRPFSLLRTIATGAETKSALHRCFQPFLRLFWLSSRGLPMFLRRKTDLRLAW